MFRTNVFICGVVILVLCAEGRTQERRASRPTSELRPSVSTSVEVAAAPSSFLYKYSLTNDASSRVPAMLLAVPYDTATNMTVVGSPSEWAAANEVGDSQMVGWVALLGSDVEPGRTRRGFAATAAGLPGIADGLVVPSIDVDTLAAFEGYTAPESVPGSSIREMGTRVRVLGPVHMPAAVDPAAFADYLSSSIEEATRLTWIRGRGAVNVSTSLKSIKQALERGNETATIGLLQRLIREVGTAPSREFSSEGVALVRFNAEYLLSALRRDADPLTPGVMRGRGRIDDDGVQYRFVLSIRESSNGHDRGVLVLEERRHRGHNGHGRSSTFVTTALTRVEFSDLPNISPGASGRVANDTVAFAGIGRWNGLPGYTFTAQASDAGEPGTGRDLLAITIRTPAGAVVAMTSGALSEGNLQSSRVRPF